MTNNVFEEIVGESIHQDLVSKSAIILVFLGHRRALTEKHIDALWLATKKAHEAVVRVLHQVSERNHIFGGKQGRREGGEVGREEGTMVGRGEERRRRMDGWKKGRKGGRKKRRRG